MSRFILLAILMVIATVSVASEPITIEQYLEIPYLSSPTVSPDGQMVAWSRNYRSIEDDTKYREIWVAETDGDNVRQITFDKKSGWSLSWRPGSEGGLCYVSTRGGSAQLWLNPLDGSEPRVLTDLEDGVGGYWWSPDGNSIAVLTKGAEEEAEENTEEDTEEDAEEEEVEEGDWEVFDRLEHPEDYSQLWIVTVTTDGTFDEEARQLTEQPLHPYHVAWSPDGQTIALTYNPLFSSLICEEQRVALVNVETAELTDISNLEKHSSHASFSADGKKLAYFTDRDTDYRAYLNLKDIVVRDLATKEETVVTSGQNCWGGSGSTPDHAPYWSKDGKGLYTIGSVGTTKDIYRVDAQGKGFKKVVELAGNISQMDLKNDVLVYKESELHRPGSIQARKLKRNAKTYTLADIDVTEFGMLAPERITLKGKGEISVEGFLFLPPGAEKFGNHPTIIEMHGGPYSRYGNYWTTRYPWHVLSHNGYAVFIANPRGGTAYGEDFLRGVYRNFGTDDFDDLMEATDDLCEQGIADKDRLGFTGYSYGGLSTNNVISRTDKFKAAVSIAGIFNYVSAMGQNNSQLFIDSYKQPWAGDLELMWKHSPASRAADIVTPTLVMHGTEDEPVDCRQSIELFSYMQMNGTDSRLVLYPGQGHGINKPSYMVDYETRELNWFNYYVLGDETADGGNKAIPVEVTE
jgi:dipeptidyl aminopeptidase/acylaminoacyl peptidase